MTPRDVFGIIVRTIGLLCLLAWIWLLISSIAIESGFGIFLSFVLCTVGGYLLKGSKLVMELAYPSRSTPSEESGVPPSQASNTARQNDG